MSTRVGSTGPQSRGAGKRYYQRHGVGLLSRKPRPPEWLAASAGMSSMPSASRAPTSFHQRIHVAADHTLACFHALDGRQRQPGRFSELALINAEERARGPELAGGDHRVDVRIDV
jgi:hypothetical protein